MDTSASRTHAPADDALRALAKAIAPYVAEELRLLNQREYEALDPDYNERTCDRFVADLGPFVLERALLFFTALDRDQVLDSLQLAEMLAVAPRELSGNLTTPLKRRAKSLGLPLPFTGGRGDQLYGGIDDPAGDMDPQRTYWRDRAAIAERMSVALQREQDARTLSQAPRTRR